MFEETSSRPIMLRRPLSLTPPLAQREDELGILKLEGISLYKIQQFDKDHPSKTMKKAILEREPLCDEIERRSHLLASGPRPNWLLDQIEEGPTHVNLSSKVGDKFVLLHGSNILLMVRATGGGQYGLVGFACTNDTANLYGYAGNFWADFDVFIREIPGAIQTFEII